MRFCCWLSSFFVPWQKCSSWKNQVNFNRVILLCIFHSRHTRRCRNNETNRKIKDCKSKRNCAESAKKFQRWRAHPFSALFYACQRFHRIIVIELLSWKLKLRQNCASFFSVAFLENGKFFSLDFLSQLAARCNFSVTIFIFQFFATVPSSKTKNSPLRWKNPLQDRKEKKYPIFMWVSRVVKMQPRFSISFTCSNFNKTIFFVYRLNRHLHCY